MDEESELREIPGILLDGHYVCQYCGESVLQAIMLMGTLTWRCSEGHLSMIEDFGLDF